MCVTHGHDRCVFHAGFFERGNFFLYTKVYHLFLARTPLLGLLRVGCSILFVNLCYICNIHSLYKSCPVSGHFPASFTVLAADNCFCLNRRHLIRFEPFGTDCVCEIAEFGLRIGQIFNRPMNHNFAIRCIQTPRRQSKTIDDFQEICNGHKLALTNGERFARSTQTLQDKV